MPLTNYTLAYAYGDSPLGPFTYGGTLIDGRAREKDAQGQPICTAYPYGNTHGSLCQINGRWWLFYHRQTGTTEYSRQACVAPVDVQIEKGRGGKVTITEGEFNSEGFRTEGLNPLEKTPAAWACYLVGPKGVGRDYPKMVFSGPYLKEVRLGANDNREAAGYPVVNCTAGSKVGYKYFRCDNLRKKHTNLTIDLLPKGINGKILVVVGEEPYNGVPIAEIDLTAEMPEARTVISVPCRLPKKLRGKQALYFVFSSETEEQALCDLYSLQFSIK